MSSGVTMSASVRSVAALEFDAVNHNYRFDGHVIPGVTRVLEATGISDFSMVPARILATAQERGTAVHRACWFDDQDDLDESTVHEALIGYLLAWRTFRREMEFTPEAIEERVYCPRFRFAGTFDRIGVLAKWGRSIVDIKTGEYSPSWQIQLAAYLRAYTEHRMQPIRRVVVQLNADGAYKMHWFDSKHLTRDWNVFAGALSVYNYRMESGLL